MNIGIEAGTDEIGRSVLSVSGAIDVQSRESLITAARSVLDLGAKVLVLDLAEITFMDSTGIGALVELGHDAEDADADFIIRNPSPRVTRILDMTGLSSAWQMEEVAAD